jgi:V/A-type H+-transporting ATPase subunit C
MALRRKLTDREVGTDYSSEGSVDAETFSKVIEEENYSLLPMYMREAIEQAVLAYYEDKDIREIDYALDAAQADYKLRTAQEIGNVFLEGLFRQQVDLNNIRTMLRLKFAESERRDVFLEGGYIESERMRRAVEAGYESIPSFFQATPYYELIESGMHYLTANNSFLRLEQLCDAHLMGYLKQSDAIAAGPQPVIAFLLRKEDEIRKVRLVLTAKRNELDPKMIHDRLGPE